MGFRIGVLNFPFKYNILFKILCLENSLEIQASETFPEPFAQVKKTHTNRLEEIIEKTYRRTRS